jgi:hypothetical protein
MRKEKTYLMPATLEIPFPPRPGPAPSAPLEPPLVWVEPRWEYRDVVRHVADQGPLSEAELNALGAEHWELTGVLPTGEMVHYYFKRVANH